MLRGLFFIFALLGLILFSGCPNSSNLQNENPNQQKLQDAQGNLDAETSTCIKLKKTNLGEAYECITKVALKRDDLKICDLHTESANRDSCFAQMAITQKNSTICDKIPSGGYEPNYSVNPYKDSCYYFVAKEMQSPVPCAKIIGDKKELCYLETAILAEDYSACGKVTNAHQKTYCFSQIAAGTGNLTVCEKLGLEFNDNFSRKVFTGNCYEELAKAKKDPSICEKIELDRDLCYQKVALSKKDEGLCAKVERVPDMDQCYRELAIEMLDLSICEKITEGNRDYCYTQIAISKRDPNICGRLESKLEINTEMCYTDVATAKKDASICQKIQTETENARCLRQSQ